MQSCIFCGYENADKNPINVFTEQELEDFMTGIYAGIYNLQRLPINIYQKTALKLTQGIYEGFGKDLMSSLYESPDYRMLWDLRNNVYLFSGAKTYVQTKVVTSLLTEGDAVTSFSAFKKAAMPELTDFNENYLKAEYNTAISASSMAGRWMEIEDMKQEFPLLQYKTVGDARVRPTHAALDNIVRPVGDKFWDLYYPLNGWNCRCSTAQLSKGEEPVTSLKSFKKPDDVPKEFLYNSGKQRIVFTKNHPYFKEAKKDKELAKANFNLPLP
jgi:hypothetical protein